MGEPIYVKNQPQTVGLWGVEESLIDGALRMTDLNVACFSMVQMVSLTKETKSLKEFIILFVRSVYK